MGCPPRRSPCGACKVDVTGEFWRLSNVQPAEEHAHLALLTPVQQNRLVPFSFSSCLLATLILLYVKCIKFRTYNNTYTRLRLRTRWQTEEEKQKKTKRLNNDNNGCSKRADSERCHLMIQCCGRVDVPYIHLDAFLKSSKNKVGQTSVSRLSRPPLTERSIDAVVPCKRRLFFFF